MGVESEGALEDVIVWVFNWAQLWCEKLRLCFKGFFGGVIVRSRRQVTVFCTWSLGSNCWRFNFDLGV